MSRPLGLGLALGTGRAGAAAVDPRGFDFGGTRLPAGATLTRASPASVTDADGVMRQAAADAPRFDHAAGATGMARRGLLIEPAATNFVTHSGNIALWATDAGGGANPVVVTPADAVAPDGSTTATQLFFEHLGGYARAIFYPAIAAPGDHCLSIWLRTPQPGRSIALAIDNILSPALTIDGDWRRYSVVAPVAGATQCQLLLWAAVAESPATATVHAWGAQFEAGAAPSSYIATAAAPETRAADVLTLDWGARGVPDGPLAVRYLFDDGSSLAATQTVSGGTAHVPTDLPRAHLRRIERA
ncbi:MAG: hypothetical protein C0500_04360 [Sphingobium sp.]|nr:hypothetical protein [Sphingobium sp.]